MPLLLISGYPASGKTTISQRITEYFKMRGLQAENIEVISEQIDVNYTRSIHKDFKKEKEVRSALRSAIQRALDRKRLVICDSLNHIKGYRYELFCLAKNTETRYAVLHCYTPLNICKLLNTKRPESSRYPDEVLIGLFRRYERPDPKNRWDSPLFEVKMGSGEGEESASAEKPMLEEAIAKASISRLENDEENLEEFKLCEPTNNKVANSKEEMDEEKLPREIGLPLDQLYACLIEGKELTSNLCVKSPTTPSTKISINEVDQLTQEIVKKIFDLQRLAAPGDILVLDSVKEPTNKINFTRSRTFAQLNRTRQEFINFIRTHPVQNLDVVGTLFVDFINSNC